MRIIELLKLNKIANKYNIEDITFIPTHKYSFVYNNQSYIGYFKYCEEKHNIFYVFNSFEIEISRNGPIYIYNFKSFIKTDGLKMFSDSESDGSISSQDLDLEFNDYEIINLTNDNK
jgi:hypothetical protein